MYIQLSQYSHVHRGRCLPNCLSRNGRSCSKRLQPKQNPTNSFCASLYILYMSCDLQIMANLQKKYRTRVFISRKLTHMLLCVLIFTCGLMPSCFNSGTSNSVLPPYLHCPSQYHVCVLLQWCTLHGISVLLYVESTFVQPLSIITHHALPFCPPNPQKTLVPERKISRSNRKSAPS